MILMNLGYFGQFKKLLWLSSNYNRLEKKVLDDTVIG